MISALQLIVIGVLMVGIYLWIGLAYEQESNLVIDCDASLGWCSDKGVNLQVIQSTTELQTENRPALIRINLDGVSNDQLIARISGGNMYMGQFDIDLKHNEQGQLQALTSLPTCSETHSMVWRLDLINDNSPANSSHTFFFSSPIK